MLKAEVNTHTHTHITQTLNPHTSQTGEMTKEESERDGKEKLIFMTRYIFRAY